MKEWSFNEENTLELVYNEKGELIEVIQKDSFNDLKYEV